VDQRVFLWDVPSGRSLASVTLPSEVFALALGEDLLAVGLGDGRVLLLDPRDLGVRGELRHESSGVLALATDGSGRYLVGAGDDGTVYIWHVPTRERIGFLSAHRRAVWSVALSPDGKTLATASADGTVRLWSFPAGRELATLGGYKAGAWGVTFVRRGEFLAASFGDLTVRIWKTMVWEEVGALRAHKAQIKSVAAHEHLLATASEDGKIIVWDVNELLSLRPHVRHGLFSREISRSQYIVVNFADANGDVVGVKLLVEEEYPGTVQLSPGPSFDPKVRGRTQGTFGFSVTVTRPQNVRITIILTDALGLQSPPLSPAFVAR
jgi:WD40 repeat protein